MEDTAKYRLHFHSDQDAPLPEDAPGIGLLADDFGSAVERADQIWKRGEHGADNYAGYSIVEVNSNAVLHTRRR